MIKYSIKNGGHCFNAYNKFATIFACYPDSNPKAFVKGGDKNILIKLCDFNDFDLDKCKKLFFSTKDIEEKFEELKKSITTDFKNTDCEIYYYLM